VPQIDTTRTTTISFFMNFPLIGW